MKPFWKVVFGGCLGTLIAFILVNLIFFWVIGAAVSSIGKKSADSQPTVPKNAILKIDLSDPIAERTQDSFNFNLMAASANLSKTVSLLDAVQALELAAADPQVRFVYPSPVSPSSTMSRTPGSASTATTGRRYFIPSTIASGNPSRRDGYAINADDA